MRKDPLNGKFLSLELKIGKDKQRDSQKARQIEVQESGRDLLPLLKALELTLQRLKLFGTAKTTKR
jgi:hypothetical protein